MFPAICLTLVTALALAAQPPEDAPRFKIPDFRPSPRSTNLELSGGLKRGQYQLRHATMLVAYGIDARKVLGGPASLEIDRFNIRAMVPASTASAAIQPMLRTLLPSASASSPTTTRFRDNLASGKNLCFR